MFGAYNIPPKICGQPYSKYSNIADKLDGRAFAVLRCSNLPGYGDESKKLRHT